ncbi:MAG: CoA transferase [Dehalococcoidales bacterium]|nr:CoA transferase [Dehalococcoidales bacterium]
MNTERKGLLSPYRVLDLTDEKAPLCGKLMGDMGADVIKIEPPQGDPSRNIGPFYHNEPNPEKSLSWFAFNLNKRSITLNIESADGRELLKKLVKTADFLVESFAPGYMERLGLGYADLEKLNPRLIMVSITPFGQSGPYKDFKGSEITTWALGSKMHAFGDADRAPVRVSHEFQAYLNAGSGAAAAATIALYQRTMTGEGQHVDISIQEIVTRLFMTAEWDQNKQKYLRGGRKMLPSGKIIRNVTVWPCKDGDVIWMYESGLVQAQRNRRLLAWMEEEGMANDFLRNLDWETFSFEETTQEIVDCIVAPTVKFFMKHTKMELYAGAIKRRIFLYPVSTVADILNSEQLAARNYWVKVEHPELQTTITYPGAFSLATEAPPKIWCRAPLIGEHNTEIYQKELGLSSQEMIALRQAGVI